jgi:hypothetical protein
MAIYSSTSPHTKEALKQTDVGISEIPLSRRRFLIASGIAAAALAVLPKGFAAVSEDIQSIDWGQVVRDVAKDTFGGFAAFIVPSNDLYSQRQDFVLEGVGGIHNGADQFLAIALDIFVPYDKNLAVPLMQALIGARDDVFSRYARLFNLGLIPDGIDPETEQQFLDQVNKSFFNWLESDEAKRGLPLTIVAATLINIIAGLFYPHSLKNGFYQGFADLHWKQKSKVFQLLEERTDDIVKEIWADPDSPLGEFIVGMLKFLFGSMFNFTSYASYVEPLPLFDQETLSLIARPPGWDFANYQIDENGPRLIPADGWNVFTGYVGSDGEISNV